MKKEEEEKYHDGRGSGGEISRARREDERYWFEKKAAAFPEHQ